MREEDARMSRGNAERRRRFEALFASLMTAAAVAVIAALGLRDGPAGLQDAAAAIRAAAAASAAPAERSGTAVVRITRDGELWAGSTLRWNGDDLAVSRVSPRGIGGPDPSGSSSTG